jgi:3-deoxy-7-phosphoheptulonate synthase
MHLMSPKELKQKLFLSEDLTAFVAESRKNIQRIIDRTDPRLLIIMGPCSIQQIEEGLEYARRLKELADQTSEKCYLVMRAYIEKPRTRGGWKGLAYDPHLNGLHDLENGLALSRHFFLELTKMGVPIATEFLSPALAPYFEDLISWGCIGARTCLSQIHRVLASSLSMPIGFKNSIDGYIDSAISGVLVARESHYFPQISEDGFLTVVSSVGNPYAHVVLRGSISGTNYDRESIQKTLSALRAEEIPPRVLIDCSHGNAKGGYFTQKEVFQNVMTQIEEGNHQIFGLMLESNLEPGCQKIPAQIKDLQRGVSITDPCLDFATSSMLISSLSSCNSMSLNQS